MGKIRNQGSASLEATLVMSVFLLAMVSLFWMAQSVLAEAQVYEAAAETAEYMAEIAYLGAAETVLSPGNTRFKIILLCTVSRK